MITAKQKIAEKGGLSIDSEQFGINVERAAHLMMMLRDMYATPYVSVPREYVANAVDSHVEAGTPNRPVEVTLPYPDGVFDSAQALCLKIRDYGTGLSVPDTKRLLFSYGSSGDFKMASNDAIGGFGIGCKCAYAITDQFTYTIYHDGMARIWNCSLDENDVGQADLLSEQPSSEPAGIEVSIPVPQHDAYKLNEDLGTLFQYLPVPVQLTYGDRTWTPRNELPKASYSGTIACKLGDRKLDITWAKRDGSTKSFFDAASRKQAKLGDIAFVVGGYSYSLNNSELSTFPEWSEMYRGLEIVVPIGYVPLPPNRESVKYTRRTIQILEKTLTKVFEDMRVAMQGSSKPNLLGRYRNYQFLKAFHPNMKRPDGVTDTGIELPMEVSAAPGNLRFTMRPEYAPVGCRYSIAPGDSYNQQPYHVTKEIPLEGTPDHTAFQAVYVILIPEEDGIGKVKAAHRATRAIAEHLHKHAKLPQISPINVYNFKAIQLASLIVRPKPDEFADVTAKLKAMDAAQDGSIVVLSDIPTDRDFQFANADVAVPDGSTRVRYICGHDDVEEPATYHARSYAAVYPPRVQPKVASRKIIKLKPEQPEDWDKGSDDWDPCTVKGTTEGVYVPVSRYQICTEETYGNLSYGPGSRVKCYRTLLASTAHYTKHGLLPADLYGVKRAKAKSLADDPNFSRLDQFFVKTLSDLKTAGTLDEHRMAWYLMTRGARCSYKGQSETRRWYVNLDALRREIMTARSAQLKQTKLYTETKGISDEIAKADALPELEAAAYALVDALLSTAASSLMLDTPPLDPQVFTQGTDTPELAFLTELREYSGNINQYALGVHSLLRTSRKETPTQRRYHSPLRIWTDFIRDKYPILFERVAAQTNQRTDNVAYDLDFKLYIPYIISIG